MKLSLPLTIFCSTLILLVGCTEDKTTSTPSISVPKTTIEGVTTLSSGIRPESKATVCFDANDNYICDDNEVKTFTDPEGKYSLDVPTSQVKNGKNILAFGGKSLLPPNESNKMLWSKSYQSEEDDQNINVMSSLIVSEMENCSLFDQILQSCGYSDKLDAMVSNYSFAKDVILSHPLERSIFSDILERVKIQNILNLYRH